MRGGVYNEAVIINVSDSAVGGRVTFQNYPGETAVVDGTGVPLPALARAFNVAADLALPMELSFPSNLKLRADELVGLTLIAEAKQIPAASIAHAFIFASLRLYVSFCAR